MRWTEQVPLTADDLRDVEAFLRRPVPMHPNADDHRPTLEGPDGRTVTPVTAREWLDARAAGFVPRANVDNKLETAFKKRAYPALWLAKARRAERSYIADLRPDLLATRWMPPRWSFVFDEDEYLDLSKRLGRAPAWHELFPATRLDDRGRHFVRFEDGESAGIQLSFLAWGDYDGDGNEDLLLEVATYAPRGTFSHVMLVTLSRTEPGGQVLEIQRDE